MRGALGSSLGFFYFGVGFSVCVFLFELVMAYYEINLASERKTERIMCVNHRSLNPVYRIIQIGV